MDLAVKFDNVEPAITDQNIVNSISRQHFLRSSLALFLCLGLLAACERQQPDSPTNGATESTSSNVEDPALISATENFWQLGTGRLQSSLEAATALRQSVLDFIAAPSEESLLATRQAWHFAHNKYLQFEVFSFLGASSPELFGALEDHNFSVHAWPITPGYLDYFDVYTHSGIVNDIAMPLTAEEIRRQHGFSDASDVSQGYHALEYILWGENGARPLGDFTAQSDLSSEQSASGLRAVDLPKNRRRALLQLLAELLVDDLELLQNHWQAAGFGPQQKYLSLQSQSRVQLLHRVAITTVDKLQQRYVLPTTEESEPRHNHYAGQWQNALLSSLKTLRTLLLEQDPGLGPWILSDNDQQSQQQALDALQQQLDKLAEQANEDAGDDAETKSAQMEVQTQLADTLAQLATALAPTLDVNPEDLSDEETLTSDVLPPE